MYTVIHSDSPDRPWCVAYPTRVVCNPDGSPMMIPVRGGDGRRGRGCNVTLYKSREAAQKAADRMNAE